ncbi:MAG: hypothetical protein PUC26_04455 [Eubacteriales bacterium]|jgi:uncharacterized alkaline shock family protein YloU|nr:hypothetical protein [Eubacteriales bacterium]
MKVYALSGKSGTGKSFQAMNLCREKNIAGIIDDGLFIYNNEIRAGRSAKRAGTKIGAIKTALFHDDEHMEETKKAIQASGADSILVLGTSEGMVKKITERLDLGEIDELIHIEDITTKEEREIAEKQRIQQGKHVVPVPAVQLKRQFSGYFMHPLRIFKGWGFGKDSFAEKSVVRPTYSYLGDFIISDKVITDIVRETAEEMDGVDNIIRTISTNRDEELTVTVLAIFRSGFSILQTGKELQRRCAEMIEKMTAFNMGHIDIEIHSLK